MHRTWHLRLAAALSLALAVPAALGQTRAPERTVTRPDGSVIYPMTEPAPRGNAWWQRDRGAIADEQERRRVETQQEALQRQEQRMRERDAALQNPARQIAPTRGY
jgi:hypothetical protein